MKKATIVLLIIAAALIAAGVVLCIVGMVLSAGGFSWGDAMISFGKRDMVTKEYEMSGKLSGIDVTLTTSDVEILPATDGVTKVLCREDQKEPHEVLVEDGVLKIGAEAKPWYQRIHLFSWGGERKVTIYLAETEMKALSVTTDTGDVFASGELSFENATLKTDTGEIEIASSVAGALNIKVSTGDVSVLSKTLGSLDVTATTGDVSLSGVSSDEIKIQTTTGEIEAHSVSCRTFSATSSTGEHEYERLIVGETLTLEASTGDISLDGCDAAEVRIVTDTGDVEGRFLTAKVFYTSSDTGRVRVPKATSGGLCEITTDTGNIEFDEP